MAGNARRVNKHSLGFFKNERQVNVNKYCVMLILALNVSS